MKIPPVIDVRKEKQVSRMVYYISDKFMYPKKTAYQIEITKWNDGIIESTINCDHVIVYERSENFLDILNSIEAVNKKAKEIIRRLENI